MRPLWRALRCAALSGLLAIALSGPARVVIAALLASDHRDGAAAVAQDALDDADDADDDDGPGSPLDALDSLHVFPVPSTVIVGVTAFPRPARSIRDDQHTISSRDPAATRLIGLRSRP
jgi:hypothetical protein